MGSAMLLAATEGFARFHRVQIHDSLEATRDVDIAFYSDCGRANAHFRDRVGPIAKAKMYRQALWKPVDGAATLVHEWGHYHYTIHDEYVEGEGTVDWNSAMGSQRIGIEFCSDLNHFTDGGKLGPRSAWHSVFGKSGVHPPRPPTSKNVRFPQNRSKYLDVLHQLSRLMSVRHVRNSQPMGRRSFQECQGPGDRCRENTDCHGFGSTRCDTQLRRCIPDDGTGPVDGYCTHNNQCENLNCVGVTARAGGTCAEPGDIGDRCETNAGCSAARTSRCDDTRNPPSCIPDDGHGAVGEYCTHNNHCENRNCVGVTRTTGGTCAAPGRIGDRCETNAGCSASRTSRCDNTRSPQRCIPDDGRGALGDYCTHNNHCANRNCVGVTGSRGGACAAPGAIGDRCETKAGCSAARTSR